MFDITTSRDFLAKLEADFEDHKREPQSARHAINCVITAYHLHEWVWGDWLKSDYPTWRALGIRDKETFKVWLDKNCPWFGTIQNLTNGAKHFARNNLQTEHVSGYGSGPFGVGPYGEGYLLIDLGESLGNDRWKTASDLLEETIRFWRDFFDRYAPANRKPAP